MATSNTLPITIQMGALPPAVQWTPQQLADAIASRLSLVTAQSFSLFVSGSTAPSSNVGPWLKDGKTWYVWSDISGGYVPQAINQASLGYFIGNAAPDNTIYKFWIKTNVSGSPQGEFIWFSGAWVDIYDFRFANYSSTAAMNAAIAAAVAGVPVSPPFATYPGAGTNAAPQSIPANGVDTKFLITQAPINPAPVPINTTTSRYVVPATGNYAVAAATQFDNNTATASGVEVQINLSKNGTPTGIRNQNGAKSPNGSRWSPGFTALVPLVANDYLELFANVSDGVGTGAVNLTDFHFSVWRVSA